MTEDNEWERIDLMVGRDIVTDFLLVRSIFA